MLRDENAELRERIDRLENVDVGNEGLRRVVKRFDEGVRQVEDATCCERQ